MADTHPSLDFKRFSDAISDPLIRAERASGLGLGLLTLGAILMVAAFFMDRLGPMRYIVLILGAGVTFSTLGYVYFKAFPHFKRAQASVDANKEMIDAMQQSAIELTELASDLQALAFKNANQVAEAITKARPLIRKIPLLGRAADSRAMVRAEGLSSTIVTNTQHARKIIVDLQQALVEANPKYLRIHLEDLRRYRGELKRMLKGKNP
jgi:hypothetical protein